MPRTLIMGGIKDSWREWLEAQPASRPRVIFDLTDPSCGPPGNVTLTRDGKRADWRFIGTLDPAKNPIGLVAAITLLAREVGDDAIFVGFRYRHIPTLRQLAATIAEIIRPDEIILPQDANIPTDIWPIGPTLVETEHEFPDMVQTAQRRARWIEMLEAAEEHTLALGEFATEGVRLGSGEHLPNVRYLPEWPTQSLRIERSGSNLLLVTHKDVNEDDINRLMNLTHTLRVHVVSPMSYSGRLCSFAKQSGEDFGIGIIEELDLAAGVVRIQSTAVAPSPVRILRIGTLRIDSQGREQSDEKPWSI